MHPPADASIASDRSAAAHRWGALALLLFLGVVFVCFNPIGFEGGLSDDQRYFDAAYAWWQHGPVVGTTHWALRLPFVLSIAAAFGVFGVSLDALIAVPAAYFVGTLLVMFATLRRFANERAAWIWAGLFVTTPLSHRLATFGYPDIVETFFVASSLCAFVMGVPARAARRWWFLTAGVAASLAILTRETAVYLVLIYAAILVAGRPVPRRSMLWVLAGAVPLIAVETIWLWWNTGDWLYRAHVSLNHVHGASPVRDGEIPMSSRVLFNPDVARRWHVRGPVNIHWTVNPLVYFFLDKRYGTTFWLAVALLATASARLMPQRRRLLTALLAIATASFLFQTYVVMVSQRPRFYAVPVICATAASAILLDRLLAQRRRVTTLLISLLAIVQLWLLATTVIRRPASFLPDAAIPLIGNAAETVYTEPVDAGMLSTPLALRRSRVQFVGGSTPVGALNLVILRKGGGVAGAAAATQPACCWRIERTRPAPLLWWQSRPSFVLILRRRIA